MVRGFAGSGWLMPALSLPCPPCVSRRDGRTGVLPFKSPHQTPSTSATDVEVPMGMCAATSAASSSRRRSPALAAVVPAAWSWGLRRRRCRQRAPVALGEDPGRETVWWLQWLPRGVLPSRGQWVARRSHRICSQWVTVAAREATNKTSHLRGDGGCWVTRVDEGSRWLVFAK